VAIITSHPIAPFLVIPHQNLLSDKAIIQPIIEDAQFTKKFNAARGLHQTMLFLSDNSRFKKHNVQTSHPENDAPPNNAQTYMKATSGQHIKHPSPSFKSIINNKMPLFYNNLNL
jgi:hypothetical protein